MPKSSKNNLDSKTLVGLVLCGISSIILIFTGIINALNALVGILIIFGCFVYYKLSQSIGKKLILIISILYFAIMLFITLGITFPGAVITSGSILLFGLILVDFLSVIGGFLLRKK